MTDLEWCDARDLNYRQYLAWGWSPMDAAWNAYFGKPFRAALAELKGAGDGTPG
jgi:hypothetical protein